MNSSDPSRIPASIHRKVTGMVPASATPDERVAMPVPVRRRPLDRPADLLPGLEPPPLQRQALEHLPPGRVRLSHGPPRESGPCDAVDVRDGRALALPALDVGISSAAIWCPEHGPNPALNAARMGAPLKISREATAFSYDRWQAGSAAAGSETGRGVSAMSVMETEGTGAARFDIDPSRNRDIPGPL